MARQFKRVAIFSDLHSNHRVGLTPPKFQSQIHGKKYYKIQQETWKHFQQGLKLCGPIDIAVINGDAVDIMGGFNSRVGTTEILTNDPLKACEISEGCIREINSKQYWFTHGTPIHVGPQGEDYERLIADKFDAEIRSHLWLDINGTVFDIKHQAESGTGIPHGKGTPLSKEWLWNLIWHDYDEQQPRADIIIRSHLHFPFECGDPGSWKGWFTPALQAAGTKYGARRKSGLVKWGFIWFDCYPNKEVHEHWYIVPVQSQKRSAVKL